MEKFVLTFLLSRRFSFHVLCGVQYLHSKGIIHRDIKGGNILVTDTGIAKLSDFGCSKQLAGLCTASMDESLRGIKGSVHWMAPEVIKQSGARRSSDIWSIGATIIEMGMPFFLFLNCPMYNQHFLSHSIWKATMARIFK